MTAENTDKKGSDSAASNTPPKAPREDLDKIILEVIRKHRKTLEDLADK